MHPDSFDTLSLVLLATPFVAAFWGVVAILSIHEERFRSAWVRRGTCAVLVTISICSGYGAAGLGAPLFWLPQLILSAAITLRFVKAWHSFPENAAPRRRAGRGWIPSVVAMWASAILPGAAVEILLHL